ncbi:hypothetical protein [Saccharothrix syringae]|uniref:Uncharacterized protein n=1 Tax=Saccharothrix syringae TaxID=103733 RepID=A0A5Q0HAY5_SACSY|nr:hypothetical protein [Saccharothrix syringae]QFZ23339.1 hypothetical protein EKG83_43160 [Saccharothrix syringae]
MTADEHAAAVEELIYNAQGRLLEALTSGERVELPGWMLNDWFPVEVSRTYWLMPDGSVRRM